MEEESFDPVRKFLLDYMIAVFMATVMIAVMISLYCRRESIGFLYFFLPFGLGIVYMLPEVPVYLKEDIGLKQMILLRGIRLVILECTAYYTVHFVAGSYIPKSGYIVILILVPALDILVYVIRWRVEKQKVRELNQRILKHRSKQQTYERKNEEDAYETRE